MNYTSTMSSRALRKLKGENIEDEINKIRGKTKEDNEEEEEEEEEGPRGGGGGGGARPKQRRNPFEMVRRRLSCVVYSRCMSSS